VRTPYRDQSQLPNYDAAGKDFNFTSIYSDNAWSGVDRVSDSHQLTIGATTRLVRDSDGAEVLRLGLVQRVLIDPERVTPDDADPSQVSATPLTRKLSDLLLIGSTQIVPRWTLEGSMRYNADTQRATRSVLSARYNAGDFRALSASYRFTRGQAEQIDFGWQWPLAELGSAPGTGTSRGVGCSGRLYSVGRVNYSMLDSRITDSLLGLEYDAGCWIGRIVAERVSTGRTEATTRLMLQLELVGLSRLGSNPLRVLKDNIPGYRLLREERSERPSTSTLYD
jgi:LPS-assembly protein